MLVIAAERSFSFPYAMHAGLAAHQPVFVDACFNLLNLHAYNITPFRVIVKGQSEKVIHNFQ